MRNIYSRITPTIGQTCSLDHEEAVGAVCISSHVQRPLVYTCGKESVKVCCLIACKISNIINKFAALIKTHVLHFLQFRFFQSQVGYFMQFEV